MKLFLGLTSIMVISIMFMSLDYPHVQAPQKPEQIEHNRVLDRLAELGSKCLYLELKWEEIPQNQKFDRLHEANILYAEFEYLQFYLKEKLQRDFRVEALYSYRLVAQDQQEQLTYIKSLRLEVDKMYNDLVQLRFDDEQLFEALYLVTQQLEVCKSQRKTFVLNGVAKALAPFKQEVKDGKGTQLFEQLEKLCSTVKLVQSKDIEGLYILSLKSALHEIEFFIKNTGLEEPYNKV